MKVSHILCTLLLVVLIPSLCRSVGITPEQIYQTSVNLQDLIATWEILPEEDPLGMKNTKPPQPSSRTLMTLRKDGMCRIVNRDYPNGIDGLWFLEDHKLYIDLPENQRIEHFVYGVRVDFMITRYPSTKDGKDLLWSRVK